MSATAGRKRRYLATATVAVLIAAGSILATGTAASAVDPLPSPAPLEQRDSSVVTADNLPTVQINDGYVWAQATIGNTVYAGGSFSNARPAGAAVNTQLVARSNILAYDITTGVLNTTFAPTVNGVIRSIATSPDGRRVYIGGSFNTVNGQSRYSFAALDATTGALIAGFSPSVGGSGVFGITATASAVYVGGNFTQANGTARKNLAAFDTATGALLPWAPTTDLQVDGMVMNPGNGSVIAAGRFYQVNAQVQRGLAKLDPVSGAVIPWAVTDTVQNGWNSGSNAGKAGIFSITADASGVYGTGWVFADVTTGNLEGVFASNADGSLRWVADCHGDNYGVYSTGQTIYTTSHTHQCDTVSLAPEQPVRTFRYMTAFTADVRGLLSRSPSVGSIYKDWSGTPSPSAYAVYPDFTVGTTSGLGQAGLSVTGSGNFISVGGEFGSVNNQAVQGLVRFSTNPSSGARQGPRIATANWAPTAKSVSPGSARIYIPANWDRDDMNLTYDLRRVGSSTVVASTTVASTWWNQPTVTLKDSGLTPGSTQSYTVTARDGNGNAVTSSAVSVTIAAGTPSAYADAVLDDNANLLWRMGGVTADWAGSADPVIGAGVSTVTPGGVSGTDSAASAFTGTSTGRVSSPTAAAAPTTFSTELWFRTNTSRGGKLIGYGDSQTGTSGNYDRQIYMNNNGNLIFGVYPNAVKTVTSPATYRDNAWHYAVATQGADGIKLYVDGVLVASDASVTGAQSYSGYWRVGGDNISGWTDQPTSNFFAGSIDEVAVYATPLTAAQVSAHYAIGKGQTLPTAAFTSAPTNLTGAFDATTSTTPAGRTITSYAWNFGDGTTGTGATPSHTYSTENTYQVTLTVTDSIGLTSTVTNPITVTAANVLPTASFTNSVSGLTVSVDGTGSTDSDGTVTGYSWNWGDGTAVSTGATPSHTYAAEGPYTVTLTVTDNRGGTAQKTASVTATHAAPTADFTAVASGLGVTADASASVAADAATLTYSWNWGDSTAAGTGRTAAHTYATAGPYTIVLTITDSLGKTATKSVPVTVSSVAFAASDSFGRTSASGWGAADIGGTWSALYGAASAGTVADGLGKITLPAGQTRNMALTAVSLQDTQTTVKFSLSAAPSTGNSYVGIASRQSASSDYTMRAWVRSEGTIWLVAQRGSTVLTSTVLSGVTWAAGDTFTLKTEVSGVSPTTIRGKLWKDGTTEPASWQLTTTDSTAGMQQAGYTSLHFARAASATAASTVSFDDFRVVNLAGGTPAPVNTAPTAAFTFTTSALAATVNGSSSSDTEGAIASYSWNWGDGTAAGTGATPAAHTYASANTYQVSLTVTDAGGLTNTITKPVTVTAAPPVNTAPTAAFTFTTSALAATVNGSSSSDTEGAIASYSWNWGDGTAAGTGATPAAHTYASANTYQVSLTVTDAGGLTNTITKPVTVTAGIDLSAFLAADDFGRTTTSGFGTADKGGAWTTLFGSAADTVVNGSVGRMSLAAGQTRNAMLSTIAQRDVATSVDFSLDQAPAAGSSYVGVVARQTAADNYQVRVWLNSNGSVWLVTQRGSVVLGTYIVPGITRAAGDSFTLKTQVTGSGTTTIVAKLWRTGTTEPTDWQISSTDTTAALQTVGSVGLHGSRGSTATATGIVTFDNFRVTALN